MVSTLGGDIVLFPRAQCFGPPVDDDDGLANLELLVQIKGPLPTRDLEILFSAVFLT